MSHKFHCAVITGASSGIGLELAKVLATRSEHLILVARRRDRLETLALELASKTSCHVHVLVHDLEQVGAGERLWQDVSQGDFIPDLWVNNAGYGLYGESLETSLDREQAMVQLNVVTTMTLTKLAAQAMAQQGGGTILNLASVAAFQPGPRMSVYFASKAFVLSFSEAMDQECQSKGVRVLALCPGNTATGFQEVAGAQRVKFMQRAFEMTPAQVAKIAMRQIDRGKRVEIPGLLNKLMVWSSELLPRKWVLKISDFVLRNS